MLTGCHVTIMKKKKKKLSVALEVEGMTLGFEIPNFKQRLNAKPGLLFKTLGLLTG